MLGDNYSVASRVITRDVKGTVVGELKTDTTIRPVTVNHSTAKISVSGSYNGPVGDFTTPSYYVASWRQIDAKTLEASYLQKIVFSDGTVVFNEAQQVYTYSTGKRLAAPPATDGKLTSYKFDGSTVSYEALSLCRELAGQPVSPSILDTKVPLSVLVATAVAALLIGVFLSSVVHRQRSRGRTPSDR